MWRLHGASSTTSPSAIVHAPRLFEADGANVVSTIEGLAPKRYASRQCRKLLGEARIAVRVLHAGHDPHDGRVPRASTLTRLAEQVRQGIEGNLCRCTGYQNIVRAVREAASVGGA